MAAHATHPRPEPTRRYPPGSGARQPGSGQFAQFGQNEPVPDAGKTHAKKTTVRKVPEKCQEKRLDSTGNEVSFRRLRA